ncbi:MAG: pyrroloquinoline quinone precursor peptide PqqA [Rhodomicrobium sp.]
MKKWTKPVASTVDAGFEVTRYLPAELDLVARRACKQ